MVLDTARIARWLLQSRPTICHRLGGPETLEGHAERHQPQIALLAISCRPGQLHHGPLQPQRRRRLHQSLRATGNGASESEGRKQIATFSCRGAAPLRPSMATNDPTMPMTERKDDRLWGGRFEREPNAGFDAFQRSFAFDRRLLPYELAVDRAWANALQKIAILTETEVADTLKALDRIAT